MLRGHLTFALDPDMPFRDLYDRVVVLALDPEGLSRDDSPEYDLFLVVWVDHRNNLTPEL